MNCSESILNLFPVVAFEVDTAATKVPACPLTIFAYQSAGLADVIGAPFELVNRNFTGIVLPALCVFPSLRGGRNPLKPVDAGVGGFEGGIVGVGFDVGLGVGVGVVPD